MATYPIPFNVSGELEVADDVCPWYICNAPYGITMLSTGLAVKTPSDGASILIDIEWSADGVTWASIFGSPFKTGTHDGLNSSGSLINDTGGFTDDLVGLIIDNVSCLIATLAGGTVNDWDILDGYTIAIAGGIEAGEYLGVGGTPTVTTLSQGNLLRLDVEQCGVHPDHGSDLTVNLMVRQ